MTGDNLIYILKSDDKTILSGVVEPTGGECVNKYYPSEISPGGISASFNEPREKILKYFYHPKKSIPRKT